MTRDENEPPRNSAPAELMPFSPTAVPPSAHRGHFAPPVERDIFASHNIAPGSVKEKMQAWTSLVGGRAGGAGDHKLKKRSTYRSTEGERAYELLWASDTFSGSLISS